MQQINVFQTAPVCISINSIIYVCQRAVAPIKFIITAMCVSLHVYHNIFRIILVSKHVLFFIMKLEKNYFALVNAALSI